MQKRELLAPAGDIEAGYAALYYGADAVYLGLSKFSARATATNFDAETLDEFTAYAHSLKRKVYVALNTVIQEGELSDLLKSLDICTKCKVDGLIIQDLGVARVMREQYPWFEMHASTQMAVHNKEGALFLKKMGFKRVVLARELTLKEIQEISAIEDLETEAFIHGALCYSYSGLCQFSAIEYGRSANRGKCMYPCRAAFQQGGKECHLFSMKDMALAEDILKLPVDSLKIEGRKKSALYVAAVTDYYRGILDGKGADAQKEENIKQIFSRPWCKFHFNGRDKAVIDREFVGHRGLLIGTVENISRGKLVFTTNHTVARHDGLQIDAAGDEKPYGFAVLKLYVNHRSAFAAAAGETVEIELPKGYPHLSVGDKVYLASSGAVKGAYHYSKPKPNLYRNNNTINVIVKVNEGEIIATAGEFSAQITGKFEKAANPQKTLEAIQKAFAKTGDTALTLNSLNIENPKNLFTPASMLNELRRDLYGKIRIEEHHGELPAIIGIGKNTELPRFALKVDDINYLNKLDLDVFSEIIYQLNPQSEIGKLNDLPKNKIRLALPAVCRQPEKYDSLIRRLLAGGFYKWEVANYWGLEILPIKQLDIHFDNTLYMLNTQALAMAAEIGASGATLSIEDMKSNICNIIKKSNIDTTLVIYQDIPLFTSVGCIRNNDCRHCTHQDMWFDIERQGRKFKALSRDCETMIFDTKPYCIAANVEDLSPSYFRMDFVYRPYTAEEVKDIVEKLLKFEDVSNCIKGNFLNNNI